MWDEIGYLESMIEDINEHTLDLKSLDLVNESSCVQMTFHVVGFSVRFDIWGIEL